MPPEASLRQAGARMLGRFTLRQYVVGVLVVLAGMLIGALLSIGFRSDPFAGEAIGAICALGFLAFQTFMASHKRS